MASNYIPDRGDIVWLQFNPQAGNEHRGHRPAIVISPKSYNKKVGLAIFCPITSKIKGYPFEVILCDHSEIEGSILSDQVKSLDWKVRKAQFIEKASSSVMKEVHKKLMTLI